MTLTTFLRTFAALLVCTFSTASSAEIGMDMKLMNATFPFWVCVHTETDRELEKINTNGHKSPTGAQLEGTIWGGVLDNCKKHFGDSEKGLILLHYSGNNAEALGYWEGVVYSARAYVISRTISYEQANHP